MSVTYDDSLDLLPGPDASLPSPLWQTEIERRAAEVIAGSAELEDAEMVHRQIAERLRSLRG